MRENRWAREIAVVFAGIHEDHNEQFDQGECATRVCLGLADGSIARHASRRHEYVLLGRG